MNSAPHAGRPLSVPSGRARRVARLGTMATSIAGNMALSGIQHWSKGTRPTVRELFLTPGNMRRVAEQLSQMRGAAMKIGQLLSMDAGDILPAELSDEFARLRAGAHFMPPRQLKQVLNANWPSNWVQAFDHFDVRPLTAASIGQVHRATLRDGRTMAIKVQYPGVEKSIDSDIANVAAILRRTGLIPSGFDLAPYLEEARRQLHEETDYLREGAQLRTFSKALAEDPGFTVPDLQEDWSTKNILAMSFVPGRPIERVVESPQEIRDDVATRLISLLLREVFEFNLVQTDANFANYLFDKDTARIALLDFGATRRIDPAVAAPCRALLAAGLSGDREGLREAGCRLGILAPNQPDRFSRRIVAMLEEMFTALTACDVFDFGTSDLARRMHDQGMALAADGYIPTPLPMDLLHVQRKIGGIFLLATRLRARVPVRSMLFDQLANSAPCAHPEKHGGP